MAQSWKAESKNNGDQSAKRIPWAGCTDVNNPPLFRQTTGGLAVCALSAFLTGLDAACELLHYSREQLSSLRKAGEPGRPDGLSCQQRGRKGGTEGPKENSVAALCPSALACCDWEDVSSGRLSYGLLHHTADGELGTSSWQGQTLMRSARQKHATRGKPM